MDKVKMINAESSIGIDLEEILVCQTRESKHIKRVAFPSTSLHLHLPTQMGIAMVMLAHSLITYLPHILSINLKKASKA